MKSHMTKVKFPLVVFIPMLFLLSCTGIGKTPQHLAASLETTPLKTLAIYPVSYTARYAEPLDVRLSRIILRATEKQLQARGYDTLILSNELLPASDKVDTLALEPTDITAGLAEGVDGVVVIRVLSHFGIDITERTPDTPGPAITINATARLISVQNPEELWRDKGMGRSYSQSLFLRRTQFLVNLNEAVRSLTDNLFHTFPARSN